MSTQLPAGAFTGQVDPYSGFNINNEEGQQESDSIQKL